MSIAVTVLDYGIGNLLNVVRALQHCGASVTVVDNASQAAQMPDRVVLPGVGAFADGMAEVRKRGFDGWIHRYAQVQRPFLGICVGAQMLFEVGEEFGEHAGLGLIPGRVQAVPKLTADGSPHRIPHIGWSALSIPAKRPSWQQTLLADVQAHAPAYFVHSFAPVPAHEEDRLADAFYNGQRICAAAQRNQWMGCQFHPERSAQTGLSILKRFLVM
jgi:imidazole glycerol-phosphate synthase subunit HisH